MGWHPSVAIPGDTNPSDATATTFDFVQTPQLSACAFSSVCNWQQGHTKIHKVQRTENVLKVKRSRLWFTWARLTTLKIMQPPLWDNPQVEYTARRPASHPHWAQIVPSDTDTTTLTSSSAHSGVTRVGVTRGGNWRYHPYFFPEKKLTTVFAHHCHFLDFTRVSPRTFLPFRPPLSTVLCKFSHNFYSASALLAMQSAVLARGILSVRLSVCPSVTFRYCVQTNEDTILRFSASGRTIPLVSGEFKFIRIFAGNHPQRGR